jgi:hypothetical protein
MGWGQATLYFYERVHENGKGTPAVNVEESRRVGRAIHRYLSGRLDTSACISDGDDVTINGGRWTDLRSLCDGTFTVTDAAACPPNVAGNGDGTYRCLVGSTELRFFGDAAARITAILARL